MRVWIGIDDTDSRKGMCTTYLAVTLIEKLEKVAEILGLPRIIRLNPTIPFKTRGNGAVSFLVETDDLKEVVEISGEIVMEFSELDDENTNPGIVFVDDEIAQKLSGFAERTIKDVVTLDDALFIINKYRIPYIKFKKGRGIIGALASVGAELQDYTLELLVYRYPEKFGKKREFDRESFFEIDYRFYPKIFDTVDWCNDEVVAVPGSPCPVLYGLRGESIDALYEAMKIARTEPFDKHQIFITNHATDMHIIDEKNVESLKNYRSYKIRGVVSREPHDIQGGHVFFELETRFGLIKCAAFEPTKQFRNVVRKLMVGDVVEVYGSMKNDTINLEKMEVVELTDKIAVNPMCKCGRRMESVGKDKGFRCKKCKTFSKEKQYVKINREIVKGFYEVPPSARRHLTKPLIRMKVKGCIFR